jgi:hypothetical protein
MTETPTRPRLQGRLEWYDSKSIHIQARFDKVAIHQNRLMLISLVAYSQDVKALRAGLAAGLNVPMRLRDVTLTKDDETIAPNDVWPSGHGYRVDAHRLGFGTLHAIFTCRQPGLLLDDGDDAWAAPLHPVRASRMTLASSCRRKGNRSRAGSNKRTVRHRATKMLPKCVGRSDRSAQGDRSTLRSITLRQASLGEEDEMS